ncbi:MAG TPA: Rrf2 family transcriptional regulator [Tepidisphaeraceae bacterium]|jgi:Rrf2 family protein|nr:Rrf2 family transcriptional regulator [Tepidisphaeraceae bacterium]
MFSQTVEYALRAVVCLAQSDGNPLTTQQISALTRVPASYMSKVLQLLGRATLISATRGIGGGYVLSVRPAELSVLQVVNAIDPLKRISTCPLGLPSHGAHLCPLHARLDRVLADAEESFRSTTIAELLIDRSRSTPLCEMRPVKGAH